jgi:hypothetical protein
MSLSKFPATSVLTIAAISLFLLSARTHAALIAVSGQLIVSGNYVTEFIAGDTFNFTFTLNDTTTDSNTATFTGQFAPGVSGFSLVRGSGNTGTWDPASGAFAAVHNFVTNANGESVTLQVSGSGFPQLGGQNFLDLGLSFSWDRLVRDFVDTGSGQTFAEQAGTSGLDFSTANSFFPELRNASFDGPTMTMSVNPVPEPSSYAVVAGTLLGAIFYRRRR